MTLGLDQVPESLFPAVACSAYLPLRPLDVALIVLVFSVGELAMSRLFFAVGLRDRPYRGTPRINWCSVISGRLLKRTGTTEDPAPTDV
jgi:hypothetical protein